MTGVINQGIWIYCLAGANLLMAVLCLFAAWKIWRIRNKPLATPFSGLFLVAGVWGICYGIEIAEYDEAIRYSWMIVRYMAIAFASLPATAVFMRFAGWPTWPQRSLLILLLIPPSLTILALLSNSGHRLFWTTYSNIAYAAYDVLQASPGPLYWVHVAYSYGLFLVCAANASPNLLRIWRLYRKQTLMLSALLLPAFLLNAGYIAGLSVLPGVDLAPLWFGLAAAFLLACRKLAPLLNTTPFAYFGVADQIIDSVLVVDIHGRVVELNESAAQVLGRKRSDLLGRECFGLDHPILAAMHRAALGDSTPREISVGDKETQKWYELRISPLNGPNGQNTGWMGVWHEITSRKKLEADLLRASVLDQLTGLHNRLFFEEEFARIGRGRLWPVVVIMADLDNLKETNDEKGHPAGDELLRNTAQVFRSCLRMGDLIARIGGDEFAVVLPGCGQAGADSLMRRLKSAFALHNQNYPSLPIEISLGCAIAESADVLSRTMQDADQAMYEDKNKHKETLDARP